MFLYRPVLLLAVVALSSLTASAQLFYNGGATVLVSSGGILYVEGAAENASGVFSNAGETTVIGYFRNGGTATGGGTNGLYKVFGDWENNNTFTADQSEVQLNGNSQQITGSQVTTFHDLTLLTSGTVKSQTLDANVNGTLALNDCELATNDYKMTVLNPASTAITRDQSTISAGFVSSTGSGRLVRAANSTNTYLFPTGWNDNGNVLYRPIELTPTANDQQNFAVRMAIGDPGLEGYDTNVKAGNVTAINTKFFHYIKQTGATSAADLSIYYDASSDGTWGSIGRWQTVPQWEDLMNTTSGNNGQLSRRTKSGWTDNSFEPHVLINAKDITALFNFPNVFDPGSSDPKNSTFHVIDDFHLVTLQEMKIFDRWGEVVFDSQRDGKNEWDGKYRGKLQVMGNYVYMANVKINSTGEVKSAKGNLSLIW